VVIRVAVIGADGVTGRAIIARLETLHGYVFESDFTKADILVASPGVPPSQFPPFDGEIMGEIEFAWRLMQREESTYCPTLVGVTGTNGKSTVTALIAHVLEAPYAGNIGIPLISFVDTRQASPYLVLELSSYQLETCQQFRPDIAIIMNITPDHMARHETMQRYAEAKGTIFQCMPKTAHLLYGAGDPLLLELVEKASAQLHAVGLPNPAYKTALLGAHNQINCEFAVLTARLLGMDEALLLQRLASFQPLEHRIEPVGWYKERLFVNDSKGTNPDATLMAVRAFTQPVHLILCGVDKKLDLSDFLNGLLDDVKSITVYGDLTELVMNHFGFENPRVVAVNGLSDAVQHILGISSSGDVLVFSPSSASFDMYDNFEARGVAFRDCFHALE
jgi:UDP-N-acetylmuramoylalanine--D-glutamate ligase